MVLSVMIRKASTAGVPFALRAIASPAILDRPVAAPAQSSGVIGILNGGRASQSHSFSSAAIKKLFDGNLIAIVKEEINSTKKLDADSPGPKRPNPFPFNSVDDHCDRSLVLSSKFQDEKIEFRITMDIEVESDGSDESNSEKSENETDSSDSSENESSDETDSSEDGSSSDTDDCNDSDSESSSKKEEETGEEAKISVTATIAKKNGMTLVLEFVSQPGYKFCVHHMRIEEEEDSEHTTYEGPHYSKLDANMQMALLKYLEIRGFTAETALFLRRYMVKKQFQDDLIWMKTFKKFLK